MEPQIVLLLALIVLVLIFAFSSCGMSCSEKDGYRYNRNNDICEFQPSCLYGGRRECTLSDGTTGVCVLHGQCCPTFMDYQGCGNDMRGTRTSNCVKYYN